MRLQSFLSKAGVMSRRAVVAEIEAGKVEVNGNVVRLPSYPVSPEKDRVMYAGREVKFREFRYFIFHKPKGVITTAEDAHGRKTVLDFFKHVRERIYPVGRLDRDTTGLLLLTNDGDLTYRLTHPKFGVEKIYEAVVDKTVPEEKIRRLKRGILIEGYKTAPCKICPTNCDIARGNSVKPTDFSNRNRKWWDDCHRLEITLHEGRKRQIRVMFKSVGVRVLELHRKQYGPLTLKGLPLGKFRELTDEEVKKLKKGTHPSD